MLCVVNSLTKIDTYSLYNEGILSVTLKANRERGNTFKYLFKKATGVLASLHITL